MANVSIDVEFADTGLRHKVPYFSIFFVICRHAHPVVFASIGRKRCCDASFRATGARQQLAKTIFFFSEETLYERLDF